ncbi:MAG: HD domain-containing protein, partial [Lachnospiraceae bacterium]|nr:HD domain-containing protein [Lachnospiraceae bacterium]
TDITELASLKIRYAQQITTLLDSLVQALSTAIDERSHYTANHTRNMVRMGEQFLNWLDQTESQKKIAKDRRRAFLMSIWLHDVGKLTIPLEIMDKATRLGEHMEQIRTRLGRIHLLDRIVMLEGRISKEEYQNREAEREKAEQEIQRIDHAGFLSPEDLAYIEALEKRSYEEEDGSVQMLLTPEEIRCLKIPKGTLTDEERGQMQDHVVLTRKILEKVEFPDAYKNVPLWASMHHEFMNGSGYPDHRKKEEIPAEVRLLTILDIFEALTATDRPYKKPFTSERAFQILHGMATDGFLDADILDLFEKSRAWEI